MSNYGVCFQRARGRIINDENLATTSAYVDNIAVRGMNKDHDKNLTYFLNAAKNEKRSIIGTKRQKLLDCKVSHGLMKPEDNDHFKNFHYPKT